MDFYEITIKGHLHAGRAEHLGGLDLTLLPDGQTLIAGPLRDQAELHGVLSQIRDMGVVLVSVRLVRDDPTPPTPTP